MAYPRHLLHPPSPSPSPLPPSTHKIIHLPLLITIIIVSLLFLISSLVYFLVRFLYKKHPSSSPSSNQDLQRQLQQLFSLHDTGLDQASIDSLPLFTYKEILGPKDPFDCAVCLSEFSPKDKLRLLPHCSHAFHVNCIDTWLHSNSTCPLCRGAVFSPASFLSDSPASDSSEAKSEANNIGPSSVKGKGAQVEEGCSVLAVRLGKFRKVEAESGDSFVGEASSSNLDARRCYSMGSYQYVVGNTSLRVALCPDQRRRRGNKDVSGDGSDSEGRRISSVSRGDSYSISKIWLWKKKGAAFSASSGIAQIDLPRLSGETESPPFPIMESATDV